MDRIAEILNTKTCPEGLKSQLELNNLCCWLAIHQLFESLSCGGIGIQETFITDIVYFDA